MHKRVEVLDRYPDGRPHHVKAIIKILGIVDKEILEYHWGPNWMVCDAEETFQQHGQHIEYIVEPEGDKGNPETIAGGFECVAVKTGLIAETAPLLSLT